MFFCMSRTKTLPSKQGVVKKNFKKLHVLQLWNLNQNTLKHQTELHLVTGMAQ